VTIRRTALVLLAGLALGELFYVGAFEWVARSGQLAQWINRRPDKAQFLFRSAHSWFPFRVTLAGVDLSVQTPRLQWRLRCERASGWIAPAPLLARRLRVESATISDAEFGLRLRADTPQEAAAREAFLPPIAAFPLTGTPALPRPLRPAWNFEFPRLTATRVRSVWLEQLRLTGDLRATGGFAIRRRTEAEVGHSRLEIATGTLELAGAPLAQALHGALAFSTVPYAYREHRGFAALPFLDSSATLSGEIFAAPLLRSYLARAPWLEFEDSATAFDAALEMRRGALVPGSHLHTEKASRTLRFFGFEASGTALLNFDVLRDATGGRADLAVGFDDFALRRSAAGLPVVGGSGLTLLATTRDLRASGLPDDARIRIDLGDARLLDLAGFSDLLPPSAALELAGGKGEVHGQFEAELGAGEAGSARGSLSARITQAALISNGARFSGAVALDVPITSRDLAGRRFDLAGTRVELTGFTGPGEANATGPRDSGAPGGPGWRGTIETQVARLHLVEPATAEGQFTLQLSDSAPLVQLYATRKDLPRWVERLLEEPDVRATGRFSYRKPELRIEALKARFEHWGFEADLELGKDRRRGLLLLEWRKLALGVRMEGDKRDFKLTGARKWFEQQKLYDEKPTSTHLGQPQPPQPPQPRQPAQPAQTRRRPA